MTTRPFVPRATGEGSIGTSAKHWGNGYFDTIQVGDKDITALDTTGNAATATKLATARTIALSGDATGSATFDGSGDATIAAEVSKIGGTAISDFIKTLLDDGDAATARATLEANAQNCGGIVAASLTDNGYVKFANGLILEWGYISNKPAGKLKVAFPVGFADLRNRAILLSDTENDARWVGDSDLNTAISFGCLTTVTCNQVQWYVIGWV